MKIGSAGVPTSDPPLGHPPPDVLEIARKLRATFGPGVRLLRWVDDKAGQAQGRAIWDDPQAEWYQRQLTGAKAADRMPR